MAEEFEEREIYDLSYAEIALICDHTFLKRSEMYSESAKREGKSAVRLREEAFYEFLSGAYRLMVKDMAPYALCVRPEDVENVRDSFTTKDIKVVSVVGFPDGSLYGSRQKLLETEFALEKGADEIEMVINYKLLKRGDSESIDYLEEEISNVVEVANSGNALVKVILETSELDDAYDLINACHIVRDSGADFVNTSTGFSAHGAKVEDISIIRRKVEEDGLNLGIKISGGVSPENYLHFLKAASPQGEDYLELNPSKIRIGESSLLHKLTG